jgi:hypothetical protein
MKMNGGLCARTQRSTNQKQKQQKSKETFASAQVISRKKYSMVSVGSTSVHKHIRQWVVQQKPKDGSFLSIQLH